jgi:xylan 1,4-beta-xylosidase
MGISSQLNDIDRGFEIVASFPELKGRPIVIGESDPDGCAACPATVFPQNGYRNGTLYASYTAASYARTIALAEKHGVNFEGALTWAFEFEDQPYFAGFRVLSTNGIDLPVLNLFRMLGLMQGRRLAVESSADAGVEAIRRHGVRERERPDIAALASLDDRSLSVLIWHYHDDDLPAPTPDALVDLSLHHLPIDNGRVLVQHYRIDETHGNAFGTWKAMGSPQQPTADQITALKRSAQLKLFTSPEWRRPEAGKLELKFPLPRQAVSLVTLRW